MKRKQWTRTVLPAFALAACCVLLLFFVPKRSSHEQFLCIDCGVSRTLVVREVAGVEYSRNESLNPTPVSRAIGLSPCEHDWLKYSFSGSTGRVIGGWLEHGHGGNRALMTQYLLIDEEFAQELATFPEPAPAWRTLVLAIENNEARDAALARWWEGGSDREPFAAWWIEEMHAPLATP